MVPTPLFEAIEDEIALRHKRAPLSDPGMDHLTNLRLALNTHQPGLKLEEIGDHRVLLKALRERSSAHGEILQGLNRPGNTPPLDVEKVIADVRSGLTKTAVIVNRAAKSLGQ